MNTTRMISLFSLILFLTCTATLFLPDDADAARFGGGSSVGSRGSRSFSTPHQATQRSEMKQTAPQSTPASPSGGSRLGAGLMGGIGGLVLGGLLGSMLFGGGGGGFGLLEVLLIGGVIWFLWNRFKKSQQSAAPIPATNTGAHYDSLKNPAAGSDFQSTSTYTGFSAPQGGATGLDEVSQGVAQIMRMDPNFQEPRFMEGAKAAYQQIQGAWSNWSVDRLRPLLTERMWFMIEKQARDRQAAGRRDIVEKIRFIVAEISEAWQENGEDWITVHFVVEMVEYETDVVGLIQKGNPDSPIQAEEYWTFCRPTGSTNPNWYLSAVQQPGEVARSVQ
ncbi:MAG: Tim44 domain-containing protein [Magnetococcus sp. YQC-5]